MALQYGIFAANYPFSEREELKQGVCRQLLAAHKRKLYGLTIASERLQQIRNERRPNSRYASPGQCEFEVRNAEGIFNRYDIPYINTTECSIEEIASRMLDKMGLERSFAPVTQVSLPTPSSLNSLCYIRIMMLSVPDTDTNCAVSWRSRPGSFSELLMSLYESNYIRLGWLIPHLHEIERACISSVPGDCPLHLRIDEREKVHDDGDAHVSVRQTVTRRLPIPICRFASITTHGLPKFRHARAGIVTRFSRRSVLILRALGDRLVAQHHAEQVARLLRRARPPLRFRDRPHRRTRAHRARPACLSPTAS